MVLRIGEYKGHRDEEIAPQIVKSSVDSPRDTRSREREFLALVV